MTLPPDLSRWNRAGLRRFRYVDATAASFLERIRTELGDAIVAWRRDDAELARGAQVLVERYREARAWPPDWAWEIARSFARACHVLGEYLDAYANEGFLGTATQWESVRRLLALVDRRPVPPASATTALVLEGSRDRGGGKVAAGFGVSVPDGRGGAPLVFETLEDLALDPALDQLRPAGHDQSPERLGGVLALEGRARGIVVGEPLVVERDDGALSVHVIAGVTERGGELRVDVSPPVGGEEFTAGRCIVRVNPADRLAPRGPVALPQLGLEVRLAEDPPEPLAGRVVAVGGGTRAVYRRVAAADGRRLTLDASAGVDAHDGISLSLPGPLAVSTVAWSHTESGWTRAVGAPGDWRWLQGEIVADVETGGARTEFQVVRATYDPPRPDDPPSPHAGSSTLSLSPRAGSPAMPPAPATLLVPARGGGLAIDLPLALSVAAGAEAVVAANAPKRASPGDVAVLVCEGDAVAARLRSSDPTGDEGSFAVAAADAAGRTFHRAATRVYCGFAEGRRVRGWDRNDTAVDGQRIALEAPPASLRPGRRAVVEQDGRPEAAFATTIAAVDASSIELADPIPAGAGFTVGNLTLAANVALAGHGSRRPARILGSGDAAQAAQVFALDERGVSTVPDPAYPSGVRLDLQVMCGGQPWTQAPSLRDSLPSDPHYEVAVAEDGTLRFRFGDGIHGRRLPTGDNNVRVAYRVGAGLAGNVPPGKAAPVAAHARVAAVRRPVAASGGNDLEPISELRERGAGEIQALDRAVSLDDFARLAASHGSVWQARAFAGGVSPGGRVIEVVIVPAGGGPLGEVGRQVATMLQACAAAGADGVVRRFEPAPLDVAVRIVVDRAAHDPDAVAQRVRGALLDAFSLARRRLGDPLYRSDVIHVVEAVEGVVSSACVLGGDASVQRLDPASARHVLFLDRERPWLSVVLEEG